MYVIHNSIWVTGSTNTVHNNNEATVLRAQSEHVIYMPQDVNITST